jgi:hypothetical protein
MGTLSEGSQFKERFASLENGKLSIFRHERDYLEFNSTLTRPFQLNQYRIVTNPREVEETSMAPKESKFSSFVDSMRKDVNWPAALTKYRFNLVPKVSFATHVPQAQAKGIIIYDVPYLASRMCVLTIALFPPHQVNSELETLRIGEFVAHTEDAYNKWTGTLRKACRCACEPLLCSALCQSVCLPVSVPVLSCFLLYLY